ncbi:MAG: aminodeoxychorismate/anthranilate synthase component II, partial [Dehalococcoidia bacterium]|nr:aminodeoxychorismate/anthranilate synthase component II [Dehalococcoidia bacterium]
KEIESLSLSHIIISPGPCTPREAGISNDVVKGFAGRIPILGVCLGHQCIGSVYGGVVDRAKLPMHGKTSLIHHDGRAIFEGLPIPFEGGRYHSLVVYPENLLPQVEVSAWTEAGEVMGLRHKELVVEGVQFHPESVLTPVGYQVLRNFLSRNKAYWQDEPPA